MGLLMTWTVEHAIDAGVQDYIEEADDIWAAVFFGNEDAVDALLEDGVDVDAQNFAEGGDTPLHTAAFTLVAHHLDGRTKPQAALPRRPSAPKDQQVRELMRSSDLRSE